MKSNDVAFLAGGLVGIYFGVNVYLSPIQIVKSIEYDFGSHHELVGIAIITFGTVSIYSAVREKK